MGIGHRMVRFSRHSSAGTARCALAMHRFGVSRNTSAHSLAALRMGEAMLSVGVLHHDLLSQSCDASDESCVEVARSMDASAPPDECT